VSQPSHVTGNYNDLYRHEAVDIAEADSHSTEFIGIAKTAAYFKNISAQFPNVSSRRDLTHAHT